ncbi:UDP-glucosyltransferase family protein [Medicago truncatula]|uniref:UDP-glucosyltransferase family protein n=1 Tax=Medicago truncatula TaxID=3880 RepID=A0A072TWP4_MEDTR|nr:UDP-glucosyltransferase family protein [Medicago truncatula]
MTEDTIHVVMLPWSAFGHLIPFFKLSIALAKAGVHVSYISTPKNIQRLPKIPSSLSHLIDFVEIPLPSLNEDLLPEGAEATMDIPFDKIQYLEQAYDKLKNPVKQLVSNWLPNWIICDYNPHWIVDIAQEFHINLIYYSVVSAATLAFLGPPSNMNGRFSPDSLTLPPKWMTFPSSVAYNRTEAVAFSKYVHQNNASEVSGIERLVKVIDAAKSIICCSCYEIEGEYLNLYKKLVGKPVIPIGLLPVEMPQRGLLDGLGSVTGLRTAIFQWLDKQATKSVVFVGFGSECKLSKEQVFEIAYGLEDSKLSFLWGLRKTNWAYNDEDFLPIGFSERSCDRGLVCMGWIPKQEILAHSSIGGSLFHSGWGSTIEALQFENKLVVLPFNVDQPLNARLLVDKGLAIEVKRNEDGTFTRYEIAKSLRQAMVLEEGKELRTKTREAVGIVGNLKLHQDHYIAAFVQFLKDGIRKAI